MFLIRLIFSLALKIPFIHNFPKKNVANRPVVLVDLPHQKKNIVEMDPKLGHVTPII
jgi:hypothetical protein